MNQGIDCNGGPDLCPDFSCRQLVREGYLKDLAALAQNRVGLYIVDTLENR